MKMTLPRGPSGLAMGLTMGLAVVALLAASIVRADEAVPDHDRARAALEAGEIVPLAEILDLAQAAVPGQPLEIELEREGGRWIYEVEIVTPDGRMVQTYWDAKTKRLLKRDQGVREEGDDD